MELEEAIKQCEKFIKAFKEDDTKSVIGFDIEAIEIVLQALKNSIPKKKIEEILEDYQERKRYYEDENIEKDNYYFSIEEVIEVLQELLEEKDE